MGVAGAGGRIEVDPEVLLRSGQQMGSIGTQLGMLSDALGAALGSGIASGMDPAGANFGMSYGRQAQGFADALADAANSFKAVGYMLEATGYNYQNADAASTIGGSGPTGGVGGEPSKTTAGSAPMGPSSANVSPPTKWTLIQPFLRMIPGFGLFASAAMTWPSGDPSLLRLTAAQWRNLATGLSAFDDDIAAIKAATSAQDIPEGGGIAQALADLGDYVSSMSESASTIATSVDDFAAGVQNTQDAIRRLLDRISLDGLWDTVTGFLTGDGDDILREVARDVGDVLENFQDQVKGVVGLLGELATLIGDAATAFQKWIRPILVETFGDDVGNALADTVTLYTDFQVGVATGLINTVSGVVSMADPDTWKGMADVALSVAQDPSSLPGVLANMGKEFVAWDKWSGDHPGRAAGEAAFNIGSLFVPGGALSKTGTVAKGLRYTNRLLEEGRLPRLGDLPGLGGGNRSLPGLDDLPGAGPGLPGVPEFRPGAVPDSIVGPSMPNGVDAPTNPTVPGSGVPTGPSDPPGPSGTPVGGNGHGSGSGGGDGPPPDSPGQPVSPSGAGPGSVDSPTSPASSGPVDSPRISEPSASSTPSHTPETSSSAGMQDSSRPSAEAGTPPASHTPASPEASGNGHATGQQSGGGGGSETPSAPSESHRPSSDGYNGRSDGPTHTPADHQTAHTPAEQPNGHERSGTDGSQTREHPQPVGDGNRQHQESTGTTPGGMAGGGMPMAPHAPSGTHSSADGQSAAGKTQGAEAPARTPGAKVPQQGSPESPRAQGPAAGPGVVNAPGAPVNPAAGHPTTGDAGQPRPGTEAPSSRDPADSSRDGSPTQLPASHDTRGATSTDRPGTQSDQSASDQHREGSVAEVGTVPREVGERTEPGSAAGNGHDSAVAARDGEGHHPSDDQSAAHVGDGSDHVRYVELEDGTQHRVWASNEQLAAQDSRFAAADAWLAEQGLTRADVQPLLVQPADWLNGAQRELVYGFRHQFPDVASGEGLQKIIDTGQAEGRLDDGPKRFPPDETGGSVSVARDTYALNTPERVYDGLALEYDGTPFSPQEPVIAMRFTVDDGVPVHLPDQQLSQLTGHGDSFDPGYGYPFTGTGFTASDHFSVAEYFLDRGTQMNPGAEMYRINIDGSEELIAVLDAGGDWIGVKPDG